MNTNRDSLAMEEAHFLSPKSERGKRIFILYGSSQCYGRGEKRQGSERASKFYRCALQKLFLSK